MSTHRHSGECAPLSTHPSGSLSTSSQGVSTRLTPQPSIHKCCGCVPFTDEETRAQTKELVWSHITWRTDTLDLSRLADPVPTHPSLTQGHIPCPLLGRHNHLRTGASAEKAPPCLTGYVPNSRRHRALFSGSFGVHYWVHFSGFNDKLHHRMLQ